MMQIGNTSFVQPDVDAAPAAQFDVTGVSDEAKSQGEHAGWSKRTQMVCGVFAEQPQ